MLPPPRSRAHLLQRGQRAAHRSHVLDCAHQPGDALLAHVLVQHDVGRLAALVEAGEGRGRRRRAGRGWVGLRCGGEGVWAWVWAWGASRLPGAEAAGPGRPPLPPLRAPTTPPPSPPADAASRASVRSMSPVPARLRRAAPAASMRLDMSSWGRRGGLQGWRGTVRGCRGGPRAAAAWHEGRGCGAGPLDWG
jgi:hypothetical protein